MRSILMALPLAVVLSACAGGGAGEARVPDGTRFDLSLSPKGWITVNTRSGKVTGFNQDHSFYGAWRDGNNHFSEFRYQGEEATNIPRSGSATYLGNVVRVDSSGNIFNAGSSRLNVDFGSRTVNGELIMNGLARNVTLERGTLNGADFSGEASMMLHSNGTYRGSLMGPGAAEMGGVLDFNDRDLNAAFGGVKQ